MASVDDEEDRALGTLFNEGTCNSNYIIKTLISVQNNRHITFEKYCSTKNGSEGIWQQCNCDLDIAFSENYCEPLRGFVVFIVVV